MHGVQFCCELVTITALHFHSITAIDVYTNTIFPDWSYYECLYEPMLTMESTNTRKWQEILDMACLFSLIVIIGAYWL